MGIKEELQSELAEAFDGDLSDAVSDGVFYSIEYSNDTTMGSVTPSETTYDTRGVVTYYLAEEIARSGGSLQTGDAKIVIIQSELDAIPAIGDEMVIGTAYYKIFNVKPDPTNSIWTLQMRRSGHG